MEPLGSTAGAEVRFGKVGLTGLSNASQRALRKYVEAEDSDVIILTEVKWPDAETNHELEWIRPRYPVSTPPSRGLRQRHARR